MHFSSRRWSNQGMTAFPAVRGVDVRKALVIDIAAVPDPADIGIGDSQAGQTKARPELLRDRCKRLRQLAFLRRVIRPRDDTESYLKAGLRRTLIGLGGTANDEKQLAYCDLYKGKLDPHSVLQKKEKDRKALRSLTLKGQIKVANYLAAVLEEFIVNLLSKSHGHYLRILDDLVIRRKVV